MTHAKGQRCLLGLPVLVVLVGLASCRSSSAGSAKAGERLSRHTAPRQALGTTFRLTLYAPDSATAAAAATAALDRLDAVDRALNGDRPDSEITALNRTAEATPFKLSDDLFAVLQHGQRMAAGTRGAFDVTHGPFAQAWRQAGAEGRAPSAAELENARLHVGWEKLHLNAIERTATLTVPGMRLELSGIATGYAADAVYRVLRAKGCERARVEAGGVVTIVGMAPPGQEGWRTVVQVIPGPARNRTLMLTNTALAYSPNAKLPNPGAGAAPPVPRLLDPVSGRSAEGRIPAVVLAGSGATAQSVAWAAAVLGPGGAPALSAVEGTARVRFATPAAAGPARR
jgi:thiamine biosynthesis lipoprotein